MTDPSSIESYYSRPPCATHEGCPYLYGIVAALGDLGGVDGIVALDELNSKSENIRQECRNLGSCAVKVGRHAA